MRFVVFVVSMYALSGFITVIFALFREDKDGKTHASLVRTGDGSRVTCVDTRIKFRNYPTPGGAAGFSCGIINISLYYVLQRQHPMLASAFLTYGVFEALMSVVLGILVLVRVSQRLPAGEDLRISFFAHWGGCGYTTAMSPLWWLFFLSVPGVIWIRNAITFVDFMQSIPLLMVMYYVLRMRTGRWPRMPKIVSVSKDY